MIEGQASETFTADLAALAAVLHQSDDWQPHSSQTPTSLSISPDEVFLNEVRAAIGLEAHSEQSAQVHTDFGASVSVTGSASTTGAADASLESTLSPSQLLASDLKQQLRVERLTRASAPNQARAIAEQELSPRSIVHAESELEKALSKRDSAPRTANSSSEVLWEQDVRQLSQIAHLMANDVNRALQASRSSPAKSSPQDKQGSPSSSVQEQRADLQRSVWRLWQAQRELLEESSLQKSELAAAEAEAERCRQERDGLQHEVVVEQLISNLSRSSAASSSPPQRQARQPSSRASSVTAPCSRSAPCVTARRVRASSLETRDCGIMTEGTEARAPASRRCSSTLEPVPGVAAACCSSSASSSPLGGSTPCGSSRLAYAAVAKPGGLAQWRTHGIPLRPQTAQALASWPSSYPKHEGSTGCVPRIRRLRATSSTAASRSTTTSWRTTSREWSSDLDAKISELFGLRCELQAVLGESVSTPSAPPLATPSSVDAAAAAIREAPRPSLRRVEQDWNGSGSYSQPSSSRASSVTSAGRWQRRCRRNSEVFPPDSDGGMSTWRRARLSSAAALPEHHLPVSTEPG